jgi:hypothetical protein
MKPAISQNNGEWNVIEEAFGFEVVNATDVEDGRGSPREYASCGWIERLRLGHPSLRSLASFAKR